MQLCSFVLTNSLSIVIHGSFQTIIMPSYLNIDKEGDSFLFQGLVLTLLELYKMLAFFLVNDQYERYCLTKLKLS